MAFVPALDLQDRVAEYTIGVALSLAIDTIVAGILVYAGWWSPEGSLAGIISVSIVGVALCLLWSTFARRGGQTG
jgi:heme/copper-type cytochrome/quinol oxidase subunit 4